MLLQQTSGAVHVSTASTLVDEFWKTDCLQEETVEQLLIEVNGDHDDEYEDDQNDDGSDEEVFVD